jgi:hypothetical protein
MQGKADENRAFFARAAYVSHIVGHCQVGSLKWNLWEAWTLLRMKLPCFPQVPVAAALVQEERNSAEDAHARSEEQKDSTNHHH